MSEDLISREALKKELNSRVFQDDYATTLLLSSFNDIIDNAPTVKPKLKDDIIEAFNLITDQEFEHSDSFWIVTPKGKKIEFEKKRPQGEWILNKDENPECPFCHHSFTYWGNFCGNCGADMRKGGVK